MREKAPVLLAMLALVLGLLVGVGSGTAAATSAAAPAPVAAAAAPDAAPAPAAAASCHPYPDVTSSDVHCPSIAWLKRQQITKPADGLYHSDAAVTRGQMMAFLFRLEHPGEPQPGCRAAPFDDVTTTHRFCGYIAWGKKAHLTYGHPDGTFRSGEPVNRGAMAAFLFRVVNDGAKQPTCAKSPFWDVAVGDRFCGYVSWARSHRITRGVGKGCTFGVDGATNRGAMATFLSRLDRPGPQASDCGPKPKPKPKPIVPNNQCPPSAAACIDLTHSKTWLQRGGKLTYGPVPLTSGKPGSRTRTGTFRVYWKDKYHRSSLFDDAPMPNSLFFDGDIAFHQGSLAAMSNGCIHLSPAASQAYWDHLSVGDVVFVWGRAPY